MSPRQRAAFKRRVGEVLRTMRMERHWTQITLATMMKVSKASVSRWECGLTEPDRRARARLEKFFPGWQETHGIKQVEWTPN